MCVQVLLYLCVTCPSRAGLSILCKIFYQHGGENAHPPVQLPLPEAVVCLSVTAQQADHSSLGKGEFLIRLTLVIIKCTHIHHCREKGRQREREKKQL